MRAKGEELRKEFEEKRLGVEGEILLLKEDLKNLSAKLVNAKSAFELLRIFREGLEKQPLAVQIGRAHV